ncbi:Thioredoxin domain-containing protein 9 [Capsicum baccatum]|uniref:Thioredoxin domain-containing protein 9 n=1 Tax=Capsicum baccatum TaxID=33114 RepID=A0A2G2WLP3_CAPBA|nr:Thioredoxin domain-containing protein 9 [Capsicum baccatum]
MYSWQPWTRFKRVEKQVLTVAKAVEYKLDEEFSALDRLDVDDIEKSPYLAEKLRIVVRPTLALIKNSKVDNYVVGFDELGGIDEFSTEELEERLARAEVIIFEGESSRILSKSKAQSKKSVTQSSNPESDSE